MVSPRLPAAGTQDRPGLPLDVTAPRRPGLRVEATGGRRLLIRQSGQVVLLARQRFQHRGVHYLRTGRYTSPLPPISAGSAPGSWTHRFASWLRQDVPGPLHEGQWTLTPGMPPWTVAAHWTRMLDVDPDQGHVTWFGYGEPASDARDILPLRRLSPIDAARVKAYRRRHREGALPPVLLWWVSGLATLLVLDGHDRLVAALAEDAVPDVIVLAPAPHPDGPAAWDALLAPDGPLRLVS